MVATIGDGPPAPPQPAPASDAGEITGVWMSGRQPPGWLATTGVIALVVLIAGGMGAQVLRTALFTPAGAVEDYFAALATRSPDRLPAGTSTPLIREMAYEPPTDVVVTGVAQEGDAARVSVTASAGGTRWPGVVGARRLSWWGPWTVQPPLAGIDVSWPAGVNGLRLLVGSREVSEETVLHPGVYTLSVGGDDRFVAADAVRVLVTGEADRVPVSVPVVANPALTTRATTLVNRYLDACAADAPRSSTVVPDCPLRLTGVGVPSPEAVSWRIDSYPVLGVQLGESEPLEVVTSLPGSATVRFSQGTKDRSEQVAIEIGGWLELHDGHLSWHRDNLTSVSE